MNLNIRLFAKLKDRAGASQATIEVGKPAVVCDSLDALPGKHPAVDPGDEFAPFPPVRRG